MEPPQSPIVGKKYEGDAKIRYVLQLMKVRVVKIESRMSGYDMVIQLPSAIKMIVSLPVDADIKEGDILTIYTEVLANAKPSEASIQ